MSITAFIVVVILIALSVRTLFAHLQSWQLREYRWDRMRGYLKTKQGRWNIFNLWFFPGILPRPRFTGRIILIILIFLGINFILAFLPATIDIHEMLVAGVLPFWDEALTVLPFSSWELAIILGFLAFERFIWVTAGFAVFVSSFPVGIERKNTFQKVDLLMKASDPKIIKIGIAGSFGKSSTKNMLVHLLREKFGAQNVLYTPENMNQEYAIARLILQNKDFFKPSESHSKKFFVFEAAAYARGEIKQIAKVVKPQYSILTGLNSQHLETFGSIENIQRAKTELAEHTTHKSFFNFDNDLLREAMEKVKTEAEKVQISIQEINETQTSTHQTTFLYQNKRITIPWPGKFFVINALLCLHFLEEFKTPAGISMVTEDSFDRLPPQDKALKTEVHAQGFQIFKDLYSQNPDGTMQAIDHLGSFQGHRIFIGMPFLELADKSYQTHQELFQALKAIDAVVYWIKDDYADLGKNMLGAHFHLADTETIKAAMETWDKNTAVLLEGRMPDSLLRFF